PAGWPATWPSGTRLSLSGCNDGTPATRRHWEQTCWPNSWAVPTSTARIVTAVTWNVARPSAAATVAIRQKPSASLWGDKVGHAKPFKIDFQVPVNGRLHRAAVQVFDSEGKVRFSDKGDLMDAKEREKLAKRIASKLKEDPEAVARKMEKGWNEILTQRAR